eukprot:1036143-Amphidinium_carterae.1
MKDKSEPIVTFVMSPTNDFERSTIHRLEENPVAIKGGSCKQFPEDAQRKVREGRASRNAAAPALLSSPASETTSDSHHPRLH